MKTLKLLINAINKIDRFFTTTYIFEFLAYFQILIASMVILSFWEYTAIFDLENLTLIDFLWMGFLVVIALTLHFLNGLNFVLKAIYNKLLLGL